ncbi:hypothetical protein M153_2590002454 [Pseudoloma neurophilia]|uniref:Uncharacterized protein n=1 Tax=Pseudoloma neurophilia TaxID=146866 RepID=A0A0R0M668_9MICR|nr:hypothetical protein M153_2590002454 [Pseudoloma neurophilia]
MKTTKRRQITLKPKVDPQNTFFKSNKMVMSRNPSDKTDITNTEGRESADAQLKILNFYKDKRQEVSKELSTEKQPLNFENMQTPIIISSMDSRDIANPLSPIKDESFERKDKHDIEINNSRDNDDHLYTSKGPVNIKRVSRPENSPVLVDFKNSQVQETLYNNNRKTSKYLEQNTEFFDDDSLEIRSFEDAKTKLIQVFDQILLLLRRYSIRRAPELYIRWRDGLILFLKNLFDEMIESLKNNILIAQSSKNDPLSKEELIKEKLKTDKLSKRVTDENFPTKIHSPLKHVPNSEKGSLIQLQIETKELLQTFRRHLDNSLSIIEPSQNFNSKSSMTDYNQIYSSEKTSLIQNFQCERPCCLVLEESTGVYEKSAYICPECFRKNQPKEVFDDEGEDYDEDDLKEHANLLLYFATKITEDLERFDQE